MRRSQIRQRRCEPGWLSPVAVTLVVVTWKQSFWTGAQPQTRVGCADCVCARRIVSFEPIGPLTWPGDEERPSREVLTRKLTAAEEQTGELRARLAEAEGKARELRAERDKLPD